MKSKIIVLLILFISCRNAHKYNIYINTKSADGSRSGRYYLGYTKIANNEYFTVRRGIHGNIIDSVWITIKKH